MNQRTKLEPINRKTMFILLRCVLHKLQIVLLHKVIKVKHPLLAISEQPVDI